MMFTMFTKAGSTRNRHHGNNNCHTVPRALLKKTLLQCGSVLDRDSTIGSLLALQIVKGLSQQHNCYAQLHDSTFMVSFYPHPYTV